MALVRPGAQTHAFDMDQRMVSLSFTAAGGVLNVTAPPNGNVAELSSAILGAELGLPVAHLDHHASYIDHWIKLLRDDDRAILTAAAKAEEASELLLRLGGRTRPLEQDKSDERGAAALAA